MTSFWAESAWLPSGPARSVRFEVEDGRFVSVEARAGRRGEDVRIRGTVLPGLANAHTHVFQRALRGRTHCDAEDVYAWRARMYEVAERLTPESYLALARATYAEMALAGYTVVGEFHYVHHAAGGVRYDDPNAMGAALIQAAAEVGIRLTLIDTAYLAGGLTAAGHVPVDGTQRRFSDDSADEWAERFSRLNQTEMLRIGAAIHSVRRVPKDAAREIVETVGERPLHVYVSEQPSENLACQMHYGCSPTELLAQIGALGPEMTAIHATHLTDTDLDLLAEYEAQVVVCPTSEQDLGDGIAPARALVDRGISIGVGSDQNAVIDPFAEVREMEMHERLVSGERGRVPAGALVRAASLGGYQSLGWYDGGTIAPGMLADFVSVDLESVRTVGCKPSQVIYTAAAADVVTVVVGGRTVVEEGEHKFGPVAPLMREALSLVRDVT
ncbi:MAG: formimidoylglutamate deiminase [Dermatophilaceae bacterium]